MPRQKRVYNGPAPKRQKPSSRKPVVTWKSQPGPAPAPAPFAIAQTKNRYEASNASLSDDLVEKLKIGSMWSVWVTLDVAQQKSGTIPYLERTWSPNATHPIGKILLYAGTCRVSESNGDGKLLSVVRHKFIGPLGLVIVQDIAANLRPVE